MNLRTNLILFVLMTVLGGWYYFYEIRGEPERTRIETEAGRLFPGVNPDTIKHLEFHRIVTMDGDELDRKTFCFTGEGDDWQLEKPVKTAGDTVRIRELISRVVNIQTHGVIDETPEDLALYGLDHPAFHVSFTTGETHHDLFLGDGNPTGDYLYARVDSEHSIILVPDTVKIDLTRDLFQYRNRRILDVDSSEIRRLEYTVRDHAPFTLELSGENWRLTRPDNAPADTSRISDMVNFLAIQEATAFADEACDKPEQYGLASPYLEISAWTRDSKNPVVLQVGDHSDPGGKFRYARHAGTGTVFTLSEEFVEKYPADFFYLRSKTVCDFDRSDITRYRLTCNDTVYDLTRDLESEWHLQLPRKIPTDSEAAGTLLSDLAYMRAMGLKPPDTEFGETYITIQLFTGDSETPRYSAIIGGVPDDGVGRWIQFSEDETVFKIPGSDVERFLKTEFDFRDKVILNLDRDMIRTITIEKENKTLTFKTSDDTFEIAGESVPGLDAAALDDLYWSMSRMVISGVAEEYLTPDAVDLEKYGFDNPRVILRVTTGTGVLGPVLIGDDTENGEQAYVIGDMSTTVGIMDKIRIKRFLDL